jgi:hypothetical protein
MLVLSADPSFASATNTGTLLDVGFGAAASEVVKIADVQMGWRGNEAAPLVFPIAIPAGTRIAYRLQGAQASKSFSCNCTLYDFNETPGGILLPANGPIETIGTTAASSKGTSISLGNLSKGSWVQLVASSAFRYVGGVISIGGDADTTLNAHFAALDIGVGGAGSEVVVVDDLNLELSSTEFIYNEEPSERSTFMLRNAIPAGTRIAVRGLATGSGDTVDVSLHMIRG